jgi:O-antigen/teichoic acid export membrane protein
MLKPEELGLTRIMYSFTLLVGTLFPVGLNFLTIKFFPRFKNKTNGHNGYFGLLLLIAFIGYVIVGAIIFLAKNYIMHKYSNAPLFVEYFYYVFPISFCIGFTSIITGYCSALFKTSVPSFLNDVYLRLFVTIIVALYFSKLISFSIFVSLYASSYAIQLIVLLCYVKFLKALNLKINWTFFKSQHVKEIVKYTFMLALASLASIGIRNIDVLLVGGYLNLDAVAVYTLGMTIGTLIEIPVNSLGRIADSKISDALQRQDLNMVRVVYSKSVKYLILIGGIILVLLYANINEAITFLPEKYYGAKWVILIIAFSAFVNMATGINTSIIYYSDKYVTGTYLLFAMILISIGLNIILIPLYGIEGSATATAVAMILYNVAKFLLIKKHFQLQPYDASIFKILFVIAICFIVAIVFPSFGNKIIHITIQTIALVLVFVALLIGFKVFTMNDIKSFSIKNLFSK